MSKCKFAFIMLVLSFIGTNAFAQTHFTFTSITGNNATVGIPAGVNPNINGIPLEIGDEIGAFTPAGLCVGATVWNNTAAELQFGVITIRHLLLMAFFLVSKYFTGSGMHLQASSTMMWL